MYSNLQMIIIVPLCFNVAEHRDTHACVSRVGKAIDRSFVGELSGAAPRDALFSAPENRHLLDRAVAQHLYRQGLDCVADVVVQVPLSCITGVTQTVPREALS